MGGAQIHHSRLGPQGVAGCHPLAAQRCSSVAAPQVAQHRHPVQVRHRHREAAPVWAPGPRPDPWSCCDIRCGHCRYPRQRGFAAGARIAHAYAGGMAAGSRQNGISGCRIGQWGPRAARCAGRARRHMHAALILVTPLLMMLQRQLHVRVPSEQPRGCRLTLHAQPGVAGSDHVRIRPV